MVLVASCNRKASHHCDFIWNYAPSSFTDMAIYLIHKIKLLLFQKKSRHLLCFINITIHMHIVILIFFVSVYSLLENVLKLCTHLSSAQSCQTLTSVSRPTTSPKSTHARADRHVPPFNWLCMYQKLVYDIIKINIWNL